MKGEKPRSKAQKIFLTKIILENFPNLKKKMPIKGTQNTKYIGPERKEIPHDTVSMRLNAHSKERMLRAVREKS